MGIQINGQTDTISAFDNNFSLSGNVSIGGTLTYEDVTSVDAIGLSTFQAGIHVDDSIAHLGDTDTAIRFPAADTITAETGGTERLRITSTGKLEAYKGTSTTGKTSGSEAFTVGNGAGDHRFAVYPDGTTVIGGTGLIGNYNILLQNDGVGVFDNQLLIGLTTGVGVGGVPADLNSTEVGRGFINISRDDTAAADHILFGKNGSIAASMGTDTTNTLVFKTGTTEKLRINSDGTIRLKSDGSAANKARFEINEKWNNNATDFGIDFKRTYDVGGDDQDAGFIHVKRNGGSSQIGMSFGIGNKDAVSEKLLLTSDGRLGLGTDNPGSVLDIQRAAAGSEQMLQIRSHATAAGNFDGNYSVEIRHATSTVTHGMLVSNKETNDARRTLDIADGGGVFATFTNGKVGIGTDTPTYDLDVWGDVNPSSAANGGGTTGNIRVVDTSAIAADTGGVISFSYLWNDPAGHLGNPPYIKAVKTSSATGNYGGGLAFGTRVNGGNQLERMRISEEGYVTKPNQPAFLVTGPFTLTSWNSVQYPLWSDSGNPPTYDIGNHYSNGVFTAPVDGRYLFSAHFLTDNGLGYVLWRFYKNTSTYMSGWHQVYDPATVANMTSTSGTQIIQLSQNDTVRIGVHATHDEVYTVAYNYFMGYLLG